MLLNKRTTATFAKAAQKLKANHMNNQYNQFDELTKNLAQSVTWRAALKRLSLGLASVVLLLLPILPLAAANPESMTSSITDPAADAVFPYDLYGAAVPPYLDIVAASVSCSHGIFHFEIKMAAEIPANADPGFTPGVNHVTGGFGILTD